MTDLHINPTLHECAVLARRQPSGTLLGHTQAAWRERTRLELGLATDRPIIATGHQTLLWHPGIWAKYVVMDAVAATHGFGRANLIVDQHVDDFGTFEVPIQRSDGSLAVRSIELATPRDDVPMGLQGPFTPPRQPPRLTFAAPYIAQGVQRIMQAVHDHANAPNAALQMAWVLGDLMNRWVKPVTHVTATDLGRTSLSRALLQAMADDPHACALAYNNAVAQISEAGIGPLLVRDDYVELPLWRIRPDGRRMRAYDNDVQAMLDDASVPTLLPRALYMTALVRLGMCDVFIHGTGGANYDRAMELWMRNWLGVEVGHIAVATATLHLPLIDAASPVPTSSDVELLRHEARHAWHDPASLNEHRAPSDRKSQLLEQLDNLPRRSPQRKRLFFTMHSELEQMREAMQSTISTAQQRLEAAKRAITDAAIARRRDWPFALYPQLMLDELAEAIAQGATAAAPADN